MTLHQSGAPERAAAKLRPYYMVTDLTNSLALNQKVEGIGNIGPGQELDGADSQGEANNGIVVATLRFVQVFAHEE